MSIVNSSGCVYSQFARKSLLTILCLLLSSLANSHLLYILPCSKPKRRNTTAVIILTMLPPDIQEQCRQKSDPLLSVAHAQLDKSLLRRERHQFSVQSTPDRLNHPPPNFLRFSYRKRRHLGQNHQRSCSAEHALHYNNCRLNVSETNAVHKTCFKSTILRSKRFREGKAFKMSNDRKRRLDVDGSGSGSKKHR